MMSLQNPAPNRGGIFGIVIAHETQPGSSMPELFFVRARTRLLSGDPDSQSPEKEPSACHIPYPFYILSLVSSQNSRLPPITMGEARPSRGGGKYIARIPAYRQASLGSST